MLSVLLYIRYLTLHFPLVLEKLQQCYSSNAL